MISENAGKLATLLCPRIVNGSYRVDLRQYNAAGEQQLHRELVLKTPGEGEGDGIYNRLFLLLRETMFGQEGEPGRGAWLAVHPVDPKDPESILGEERYHAVHLLQAGICATLGLS